MRDRILTLIHQHLLLRPKMQVEDIYKLLYQSCMGLGHIMSDPESALTRLRTEINAQRICKHSDLLLEDITLMHPMARVNLRPFNDGKLNSEKLFAAMIRTEETFFPSPSTLRSAWIEYIKLEAEKAFPGKRIGIEALDSHIQEADFPVQHHSPQYRDEYRPSYRIVDRSVFMEVFKVELKEFSLLIEKL